MLSEWGNTWNGIDGSSLGSSSWRCWDGAVWDDRILRIGCWSVQSGAVLENTAGVYGDGLHAGGIGGIGSLDAAVVGAGGLLHVAAEMIEQAAEQQAGISSEHGIIDGIEVQLAWRPQASWEHAVVSFIFQVKLMGDAEGFPRDLPGA